MKKIILLVIILFSIGLLAIHYLPSPSKNAAEPAFAPLEQKKVDKETESPKKESKIMENKKEDAPEEVEKKDIEEKKEQKKDLIVEEDEIADIHLVGLGDSLTKGVGDSEKEGYLPVVAREMEKVLNKDVSIKNFGIRGYRSDQLVKKLGQEEVQDNIKQADYIFLTIGGNDILNIVEYNFFNLKIDLFEDAKQEYMKNLFIIVQTIRTLNPDAEIYINGLFNPFHNFFEDIKEIDMVIQDWNKTIQDVTFINDHTEYIPIYDIFINPDENLFSDDMLHPNNKGYQKISERIMLYLDLKEKKQSDIDERVMH